MDDSSDISNQLEAVRARSGGRGSGNRTASATLPGHAGLSLRLRARLRYPGPARAAGFAACAGRCAAGRDSGCRPAGAHHALARGYAVPVPEIRWLGDDPQWFGRAYFVDGLCRGRQAGGGRARVQSRTAAENRALGSGDRPPRSIRWTGKRGARRGASRSASSRNSSGWTILLDRPTLAPDSIVGASQLRERLRATLPASPRIGCLHGDYQWSNTLAGDDRVLIVIDWELAQIGATLIDLGWLLLFSDPSSWVVTEPGANAYPVGGRNARNSIAAGAVDV